MLENIANTIRGLSADGVEAANSGHPGMPIGCAEIGALLYGEILKHDPADPNWPDRDRFVLSAGHGSMWLYSLLHLSGYDLTLSELKDFRQLGSRTPGHPEYGETPGVEITTGPLGQGFASAVGMAIAEKMMAVRYNTDKDSIIDHYTYTVMGDGCMMEGISSEAASLAGHLGLGKLIAIYDDNRISIAGSTELAFTESVADRFRAQNWQVIDDVDGHDFTALRQAIEQARQEENKPSLIRARTHIAFGSPTKQDSSAAHGAPLGEEEIRGLKEKFGLPVNKKFYIPEVVREYFAKRKEELKDSHQKWEQQFRTWSDNNPELKQEWDQALESKIPSELAEKVRKLEIDTPIATRKAAGSVLQKIADEVPYLIGGSADLAPSNKTYLDKYGEIQKDTFAGRNFRFGVREHAMGAVANGIALHEGFRPFVATFLVFSDYMRPAIRLAALMKQPVIYIFTHDSIYIGEDGPTHQPVEHIESLRLIPNLKVLRPADDEETKEAWLRALDREEGPTAIILTRQGLPHLDKSDGQFNFEQGGYVVSGADNGEQDVVLIATGSEVSLAVEVANELQKEGIQARVVSVPDRKQFTSNDKGYIEQVLGSASLRVIMEAGVKQGWYRLTGDNYQIISVDQFGRSGPGQEVAHKYGFEVSAIVARIRSQLDK